MNEIISTWNGPTPQAHTCLTTGCRVLCFSVLTMSSKGIGFWVSRLELPRRTQPVCLPPLDRYPGSCIDFWERRTAPHIICLESESSHRSLSPVSHPISPNPTHTFHCSVARVTQTPQVGNTRHVTGLQRTTLLSPRPVNLPCQGITTPLLNIKVLHTLLFLQRSTFPTTTQKTAFHDKHTHLRRDQTRPQSAVIHVHHAH